MPALARPPPWNSLAEKVHALAEQLSPAPISVAKEISALFARQLRDNDIPWNKKPSTPTASSSGGHWYTSKKFWIPAGIIIGLIVLGALAACAGSGHSDTSQRIRDLNSAEMEYSWQKKKKERQDERNRRNHKAAMEAYVRGAENEIEAKLEAVQDTTRKEIRNKASARREGLYNTES